MKLTLVKLLLPLSEVHASLVGPLFQGKGAVFEDALRRVCCAKPACAPKSCRLLHNCPIPGLVARTVSSDPDLLKKHQKPGLPFVFREQEDRHQFSIVLLGSAIAHLSLLLEALVQQTGDHAPCPVVALDAQNSPVAITFDGDGNPENLPLLEAGELIDRFGAQFHACQSVRIDLETPLRMVRSNHELNRFDPVFFIRSLLRRLSSLAAYYGDGVDTDHFRHLAALAGEVRLLRQSAVSATAHSSGLLKNPGCSKIGRSSQPQKAPRRRSSATPHTRAFEDGGEMAVFQQPARGVSGSYELQGPFAELGPLLRLGEFVHLGKGASYGQGAFSVMSIP